jgi:hypothetical protein
MPTEQNNPPANNEDSTRMEAIKKFGDQYGPQAFGIVSLLLIWFTIVVPQLDSAKFDHTEQTKTLQAMREIADQQKEITNALIKAVDSIEKVFHERNREGKSGANGNSH